MLGRNRLAAPVGFLYFSSVLAEQQQKEKRYYVNQADIGGSTALPAYLTTGTNEWDKATLTLINWQTWDNSWATAAGAASTLSTALTVPATTTSETASVTTPTTPASTASPSTASTASKTPALSSTSTSTTASTTAPSSSAAALQEKSQHNKEDEDKKSRHAQIVVGVVCGIAGAVALFVGLLLLFCFLQQRRKKNAGCEATDIDNEKQIAAAVAAVAHHRRSVSSASSGPDTRSHFGTEEKELERIESPISDDASTITGSFASLSEKLKEIQQQYSIRDIDDADREYDNGSVSPGSLHSMSSCSTLNDASPSNITGVGYHAAGARAGAGIIAIGDSTAESARADRFIHSPPPPAAAASKSTDKNCESSSSDDDLYVDRRTLVKSQNTNSTDQLHLQDGNSGNANAIDHRQHQEHVKVSNDKRLKNNSPDTVTTGTTVLSEIASDDASFEQDANFPDKYNNFATELLTVKSGKKPRLIHIDSSHKNNNNNNNNNGSIENSKEKTASPAGLVEQSVVSKFGAAAAKQGNQETTKGEENERKESIGTLETVEEQGASDENASDYQSTSSKRRASQFDFESDDNEDVEENRKERKPSDGSYFTEKI